MPSPVWSGNRDMPTPTLKTGLSASEWKARYAAICKQYPDNPPKLGKRVNWDRIRQLEQFTYALSNPPPGVWRVVAVPRDPEFAARAFLSIVMGLPSGKT